MNEAQSIIINNLKKSFFRIKDKIKVIWKKTQKKIALQIKEIKTPSDQANDLNETEKLLREIEILRNEIAIKDNEMSKLKDGYEVKVNTKFFKKFTVLDSVIQEYIDDQEIDFDGIKDIHYQMKEAFAEYDIETFSPALGTKISEIPDLIDERFKKIKTRDKEQNATISEVLRVGYRRKLSESSFQIISKAKVRVFIFEES